MSGVLLSSLLGLIMFRGMTRCNDVHAAFLRGAADGMKAAVSLLPALCGMLLMLRLIQASGMLQALTKLLLPILKWTGLPQEVAPMVLLRPLTGSGSLAALQEIFRSCGVDSRAGRLASVVMGSSETIFYTLTVYTAAAGVKRVPGAMAASLIGYGASVAVCCLLIR